MGFEEIREKSGQVKNNWHIPWRGSPSVFCFPPVCTTSASILVVPMQNIFCLPHGICQKRHRRPVQELGPQRRTSHCRQLVLDVRNAKRILLNKDLLWACSSSLHIVQRPESNRNFLRSFGITCRSF